jgi:23S rRNA (uracil1939-C5)-methyltransferase
MSTSSERHVVDIESLAHGGTGVARLDDGRTVFVPRTIPGERVAIEITEEHVSYSRARPVEILEASDDRIEPDCPYFERCGGCQFWHLRHERELELKVQTAVDNIEHVGDVELPEPDVVEAPDDRRYRTRVEMHRRPDPEADAEASEWSVGYFEPESHDLVPIDDCLIATETINEARHALEPGLEDVGDADLLFETADDSSVVVTIVPDGWPGDPPPSLREFAADLETVERIRGVRIVGDDREWVIGDDSVDGREVMADSPVEAIRVPAGLFRQANPAVNGVLAERVREAVVEFGGRHVLELFCGVGNLSFALRDDVDRLVGFEQTEAAVEMASTIATFVQLDSFRFVEADLSGGYRQWLLEDDLDFDTVVLDPPRSGAPNVCEELADASADAIVYVSCDPPALARDLETLAEGGWDVETVTMFDMFPRTHHLEVLAVLTR